MMIQLINVLQTDLCTSNAGYRIFGFLGYILKIMHIFVPIIIIVMGSIDFVKALIAQKDDEMKKAQHIFIKRLILGVCVFFVISICSFVITLANGNSEYSDNSKNICLWSFLNPDKALDYAKENDDNEPTITNEDDCKQLGNPFIWKDNKCQIDISNESIE